MSYPKLYMHHKHAAEQTDSTPEIQNCFMLSRILSKKYTIKGWQFYFSTITAN